MIRVMAVYPNRPGSRFDLDYYTTRHAEFARGLLAPHGLTGLRVAAGEAALDGAPPPFWAVSEMTFTSRDAFEAGMAQHGAALFADSPNYTDVEPILQFASIATPSI
ncbi:EthD family reductase [Nostoc sp. 3335mG]|nr:EthD family reductase [Nostoc sp. 3335mG]